MLSFWRVGNARKRHWQACGVVRVNVRAPPRLGDSASCLDAHTHSPPPPLQHVSWSFDVSVGTLAEGESWSGTVNESWNGTAAFLPPQGDVGFDFHSFRVVNPIHTWPPTGTQGCVSMFRTDGLATATEASRPTATSSTSCHRHGCFW